MRLVEEVFRFRTNLEAEAFGQLEDSSQAGVQLPKPGASDPGLRAVDIADAGCGSIGSECRRIEPHGEPRGIIRSSEVLHGSDMVGLLRRVKGRETIGVLTDYQPVPGEGREDAVEFPS